MVIIVNKLIAVQSLL